jgi:hypothetical protein
MNRATRSESDRRRIVADVSANYWRSGRPLRPSERSEAHGHKNADRSERGAL